MKKYNPYKPIGLKFLPAYWIDRLVLHLNGPSRIGYDGLFFITLFSGGFGGTLLATWAFGSGSMIGTVLFGILLYSFISLWKANIIGNHRRGNERDLARITNAYDLGAQIHVLQCSDDVDQKILKGICHELTQLLKIRREQNELMREYQDLSGKIDTANDENFAQLKQAFAKTEAQIKTITDTLTELYHEQKNLKTARQYEALKQKTITSSDFKLVHTERMQTELEVVREMKAIHQEVQLELR